MVRYRHGVSFRCFFLFFNFVNGLISRYPELYEEAAEPTSRFQANFGRNWKSYGTIETLSNGDILKIDEVIQQPLEKCLLYLAYQADKIRVQQLEHKQRMSKYK